MSAATVHRRITVPVLGYEHAVCAECEVSWPCTDYVQEICQRHHLDHGLPCNCGWHDEKVAQDPEQEKVASA